MLVYLWVDSVLLYVFVLLVVTVHMLASITGDDFNHSRWLGSDDIAQSVLRVRFFPPCRSELLSHEVLSPV